jgi:serine/threonine protein kinase
MSEPIESLNSCPKCGAALPSAATAGLCPRCLMAEAMAPTRAGAEPAAARQTLAPEELAPHFPQLEILEFLGRGGMGVVYKARQKSLNRFVALKLLAPERVRDREFAERFTREAQALAALNHPNIVTIYDFGQAGGFYFLLMEYVDGVNLRQLLRARKFTPEEALAIVPPLCDALQLAHDRGIVHRDIKPENLLLDKDGRVKVADFGIAKMLGGVDAGGKGGGTPAAANATQTAMGTPGYSAPEQQTDPQRVDSRADIYSLGVVFYEMLTGELPGKRIEPPSHKVQIDVRLDEVVLRALERNPELRFQQASVFKTQVETIAAASATRESRRPISAASSPRSRVQHIISTATNIVAAVSLALIGWTANDFGAFFNLLFVFILLMLPVRLGLIVWHRYFDSLELRFWRNPLAPDLRGHRWQLLNRWLFWVLAVLTVEVCILPAQFSPSEYTLVQTLLLGGAGILMVLELLPGKRIPVATNLVFALGSIFILAQMAWIYWPVSPSKGVVLSAPFRGEWLVVHGGQSTLINAHYAHSNQRDALDLERLVNGQERTGAAGALESYPSWGERLYAPADGTVTEVENSLDDNPIGQSDLEHLAGNHVVIDIGRGRFVMLAHLQKGSVLVADGDVVRQGQPLAKCGHSGNTSHPHLHLQVQDQPKFLLSGVKTYPILFQGATRIRAKSMRTDAPFPVRSNDRIICEPAAAGKPQDRQGILGMAPVAIEAKEGKKENGRFSTFTPPTGPVELKLKWPPGERFVEDLDLKQNFAYPLRGRSNTMNADINIGQQVARTVLRKTPGGGREVELKFLGARMEVAIEGKPWLDYDSAKESPADQTNEAAAVFRTVIGSKIRTFINASNDVEHTEGLAELIDRLKTLPQSDPRTTDVKNMYSAANFEALTRPSPLMPRQAVRPGDTWPAHLERPVNYVGIEVVDYMVTFKNWEMHGNRNCARLEFEGNRRYKPDPDLKQDETRYHPRDGVSAGVAWFDPELGQIIETDATNDINMDKKVPMNPSGTPGAAGQMQTVTARMHQVITIILRKRDEPMPIRGIPKDWSVLSGDREQWNWTHNAFYGHATNGDTILASNQKYVDVTVSAMVSTTNREASLALRLRDANNGYFAAFVPDGTPAARDDTSKISLLRRIAGEEKELALFIRRGLSAPGQGEQLTFSADGSRLEVRLNDITILSTNDTTFASGYIGLRVYGDPKYPCDGVFSNLTVR